MHGFFLMHLFKIGSGSSPFDSSSDWWGPLVFIVLYAAATVGALPGSVMSVFAGAAFGPVVGVVAVIVAATIGASLAFLVGRYFARDSVARWLSQKEKFRQLDDLTEKRSASDVRTDAARHGSGHARSRSPCGSKGGSCRIMALCGRRRTITSTSSPGPASLT